MSDIEYDYGLFQEMVNGSHECGCCDFTADDGSDLENYKEIENHLIMKHDVDPSDESKTLEDASNVEGEL